MRKTNRQRIEPLRNSSHNWPVGAMEAVNTLPTHVDGPHSSQSLISSLLSFLLLRRWHRRHCLPPPPPLVWVPGLGFGVVTVGGGEVPSYRGMARRCPTRRWWKVMAPPAGRWRRPVGQGRRWGDERSGLEGWGNGRRAGGGGTAWWRGSRGPRAAGETGGGSKGGRRSTWVLSYSRPLKMIWVADCYARWLVWSGYSLFPIDRSCISNPKNGRKF